MANLLDVNALIALGWSHHVHHEAVRKWFLGHADEGWATCPITELGFIRISSNPKLVMQGATPGMAIEALRRLCLHRGHVFWPDDLPPRDESVAVEALTGHQQVTDAYLVALAARHGGTLATLDRALASKGGAVVLIQV